MSWVNGFYQWLFGVAPKKATNSDGAATAETASLESARVPDGGLKRASDEALYSHSPEKTVGHAHQHHWLFDEGVLHWNQRRRTEDFKPGFAGVNFIKESTKSRLWGCPADLSGDERVVLAGINLKFADMQGCILTRADLRHAQLQGANLRNANLASVNFENADLTDCDLRGAILDGANLARARLVNANLTGASLKATNFAWADVSHMSATQKNLVDANFFGAIRREFPADAAI